MEIEIKDFDEITVVPQQFKDSENPPKFIFKTPNAADMIDLTIHGDYTRLLVRCFSRFENKPVLKKDGKILEYNTYAQFIGLGASDIINDIHAECVAAMIPVTIGLKEKAENTEKKSK